MERKIPLSKVLFLMISKHKNEFGKATSQIPKRFWLWIRKKAREFDKVVDGAASFFVKNYGKTKFMVAMSKKAQYLGLEKLYHKGPKAFIYFFLFYLVRDTLLYIIIPIFFAKWTSGSP